jgi:hypothetical protein
MKPTVKTTIVLIVILLLGIGIGFEIGEILFRKHFDEMDSFRSPGGFVGKFDAVIQPDAAQKAKVDSILLSYHLRLEKIGEGIRKQLDEQVDSLQSELKPILTPEQNDRLVAEFKKMKEGKPHGPMPRGHGDMPPPPDGMHHGGGPHGEPPHDMPPEPR